MREREKERVREAQVGNIASNLVALTQEVGGSSSSSGYKKCNVRVILYHGFLRGNEAQLGNLAQREEWEETGYKHHHSHVAL